MNDHQLGVMTSTLLMVHWVVDWPNIRLSEKHATTSNLLSKNSLTYLSVLKFSEIYNGSV